jgi:hypothetical protein
MHVVYKHSQRSLNCWFKPTCIQVLKGHIEEIQKEKVKKELEQKRVQMMVDNKLAIHTNARLELEKMKVEFKILLSSIVNN